MASRMVQESFRKTYLSPQRRRSLHTVNLANKSKNLNFAMSLELAVKTPLKQLPMEHNKNTKLAMVSGVTKFDEAK